MLPASTKRPPITVNSSLQQLQEFLEQAPPDARLRVNGGCLVYQSQRKGSPLSHAGEFVNGQTREKREEVFALVEKVFKNNGVTLHKQIKTAWAQRDLDKIVGGTGDFKVKHLTSVLPDSVEIGPNTFYFNRRSPIATGSYGKIYKGKSPTGVKMALKVSLATADEAQIEAQRKEAAVHLKARKVPEGQRNYVIDTLMPVQSSDGTTCQPMSLALCSGDKLVEKFSIPEGKNEVNALVLQTAWD